MSALGPTERPVSVTDIVRRHAASTPDAPALLADGGTISYRRLLDHCCEVHGLLRDLGLGRDDRVALVLPNGPLLAASFVALAGGAACAPLNPAYTRAELAFYLSDLGASALVTGSSVDSPARELALELALPVIELDEVAHGSDQAPPEPAAEDIALVLHTSGTTARPKLVPLTHRNLCASASNVATTLELTAGDRSFNVMPLFHIHGLVGVLLSSLWAGGSVVCTAGFHAPSFLRSLEEWAPTWCSAVPTMHQSVLAQAAEADRDIDHALRFIRSSSAALPTPVLDGLETLFGVPAVEAYGMTEAAHQMASNGLRPEQRRRGSVGRAAGPEIAVLGADGSKLAPGEVGEVAIRGENVFSGYEANPEANVEAFADGWFRTGDEGYLDEDGFLILRGRVKEIINRGGEKISPAEVEGVLLDHPAVAQAAAFAVPDDLLGEDVGAAVVLEAGRSTSQRELQTFAGGRLADFKVPRVIAFVTELPKGPTGKVQRIGLAGRLGVVSPARQGREYVAPGSPAEQTLAAMMADVLDVERVGAADDFFALGGDSLLAAELVARIRAAFDRPRFPLSTLVWAPTVEELARELEGASPREAAPPLVVPLQTEGRRPPLVFVHALDGEIVRYAPLARRLGNDRPFLAVRARGADGDDAPHASLREMVAEYVDSLRERQAHGPYLLGGVCLGGALALEMARRLEALGEEVATVVLVDPRVRSPRNLAWFRIQAGLTGRKVLSGDYSWKLARAERRREVLDGARRAAGLATAADPARRAFDAAMESIRAECIPTRYDGPVVMLATVDYAQREWFWRPYLPALADIQELPFRHGSILRPPAVDALAGAIRGALEQRGV